MKKEYEYNAAFQKIVKSKKDVYGLLAYALLEENKLLTIAKMKSGENPPTEEEIEKIVNANPTDEELKGSLDHSKFIVDEFVKKYLEKVKPKIREECYKDIQEQLNFALAPVQKSINDTLSSLPDNLSNSLSDNLPKKESLLAKYLHGIIQSILGAVFLAMIIYYVFPAVKNTKPDDLFTSQKEETELNTENDVPSDSLPPKEISLQPQKSVSSQPEN